MVNEKLSEGRFQMLSDDYEREQAELRVKEIEISYNCISILPASLLQNVQNAKTA